MKFHRLFFCLLITLVALTVLAIPSESVGLLADPVIDRFDAVTDCVAPDPRRRILSYQVSNVSRVRIEAIHRGGRARTFYSQGGRSVVPNIGATGVSDPGAAPDVEAYVLVATGAGGSEVRRRHPFHYRVVEFVLLSSARHTRDTRGADHLARYEADARFEHFDSVSSLACGFQFDSSIRGELLRPGRARFTHPSGWPNPVVSCEIEWRDVRKARAGGTVFFNAIVTDGCTPNQIIRRARVNPIP